MDPSAFEQNRRRLWGIAYRMLGSRADAEDMVQEAYLRWHRAAQEEIRVPQAWLVTTITRLCIDRLREVRAERETYVGPWLPEPLVAESAPPADEAVELASDLSVAFLAVLERLAPEERAAFLLHEMFDSGYDEIAQILGKSEAACRQIVSRARKRVRAGRPRVQVSAAASARLLEAFVQAIRARDQEALVKLLAKEATWTADGGGKTKAALKAIRGAERIARFVLGVLDRYLADMDFRPVAVNGEPGLAVLVRGRLLAVWSIRTDGVRILDGYVVMNPDKLRAVTTTLLPSSSTQTPERKEQS
jgi:RNA polymerase sigma-70 factor (ECF subfamily)